MTLDDPGSFTVEIDSAQVGIGTDSLMALMNSYVLTDSKTPLKEVKLAIKDDNLIVRGALKKTVPLPFEITGSVSATDDGKIRVHARKIDAGHVPVKGLLHFFGEDLSKIVKQSAPREV